MRKLMPIGPYHIGKFIYSFVVCLFPVVKDVSYCLCKSSEQFVLRVSFGSVYGLWSVGSAACRLLSDN